MKNLKIHTIAFIVAGILSICLIIIVAVGILTYQLPGADNYELKIGGKWCEDEYVYVKYELSVKNKNKNEKGGWKAEIKLIDGMNVQVKDSWNCEVDIEKHMTVKPIRAMNAEIPVNGSVRNTGFILAFPGSDINVDPIKTIQVKFE